MGFWSGLGKVLKVAAPIAATAIPVVGPALGMGAKAILGASSLAGTIGNIANRAGGVGQVAGGAAQGMQDQRNLEAQIALGRDRNAMEAARLGLDAPEQRARQAARGDAQSNVQDVNLDFQATSGAMPKFNITGGLRPSLFGPNARKAGSEMSRQALLALMTKSDVPKMTPASTSSFGEKALGATGLGASLLNASGPILELLKKRGQPTPPYAGGAPQAPLSPRVQMPTFGG